LQKSGFSVSDTSSERDEQIFLIIHADDIGMCHSVNQATEKACEKGLVSSGSLMVPCPWFPETAAYFREHPEFDVGLDLTLTSEWELYRWTPVTSKERVPGLIDQDGFLWRSSEDVAQHATPDEVETEIKAQIERAKYFGIWPTHMDTHMGTLFARFEYFEVYYRVAEKYGIPPLLIKPSPEVRQLISSLASDKPRLARNMMETLARMQRRFPALDYLAVGTGGGSHEERRAAYHHMLRELEPGVNPIILHLGGDEEEIGTIIGPDVAYRRDDFLIFSEPET